ncbi:MAG TPA: cofactor-independent phosphoglycerate mutase [Kiritimatiellia bacterium]|nr:cofactor-independent phosphoglycerate mutase [Kiritimatiellia bacterium]
MKYVVLVGDGMGDYPIPEFGDKTILQAADIPFIRRLVAKGRVDMVQTVPASLPPGSDVANLSLLGYDPEDAYTGRAPIEAAGAGIPLAPDDVAVRCNLVFTSAGRMTDYSAGHISTEEAHALIQAVQVGLGRDGLTFHGGVSYRHLVVWRNGPTRLTTQPPHDIADQPVADYLPRGERADELIDLMEASKKILADHPVNLARIARGERPATQIWLWGQGHALQLESYERKFGMRGGIVSAVDLVRGLGILAGMPAPRVPGATGFLDTNFEGKVEAAFNLLESGNFVYLHIEAPDECGHLGDPHKKKLAAELFDRRVVGPVWQRLEKAGQPYRMIIAMDHRTPVSLRGHTREPVPIAVIDGPTGSLDAEAPFDETANGGIAIAMVYDWIAVEYRRPHQSAGRA